MAKAKSAAVKAKPVAARKPAAAGQPSPVKPVSVKPAQARPTPRNTAKPGVAATHAPAPATHHGASHVAAGRESPAQHRAPVSAVKPHLMAPRPHGATVNPVAPITSLPPRPVLAGHRVPPGMPAPKRLYGAPHSNQMPRDVIERNAPVKVDANKKKTSQRHGFRVGEYVVYPSHGVGKIVAIEEQVVAGHALELFVINFEQEKMTLRVPTAKLVAVGMRKLAEDGIVRRAMETLKGRARIKRTMWSRRAQEYENKINSGDLVAISEVVRDLYRAETQPEQSYSERQLFEAALDRMSREIAAIEKLDDRGAVQKITEILSKSARGRAATKAAEEAAAAGAAPEERVA